MLNTYPNLPELQRSTQLLADRFNADERFWEKLKKKRNLRRRLLSWLTEEEHLALDQLEFSRTRTPDDCIGYVDLACIQGGHHLGKVQRGLCRSE